MAFAEAVKRRRGHEAAEARRFPDIEMGGEENPERTSTAAAQAISALSEGVLTIADNTGATSHYDDEAGSGRTVP